MAGHDKRGLDHIYNDSPFVPDERRTNEVSSFAEPDRMSETDYNLLKSLYQDRAAAIIQATQNMDPPTLIEVLSPHNPNKDGIERLGYVQTSLGLLRDRYHLADTDQVGPDGAIIRNREPISAGD